MGTDDRPTPQRYPTFSRRRFLGVAASVAGGSLLRSVPSAAASDRLQMPSGVPPSRVVHIRSPYAIVGPEVHRPLLGEMLEKALTSLTGAPTIRQAWLSMLKPDDVIGLKFNRSSQKIIATTNAMADVLIASLVEAGWRPDQIVCIEAPEGIEVRRGTARARRGYASRATDFGSGEDQLASVLSQVTALVDVPFLKTHNIAGMTCALKNLSHGLVKHPARYHRNGCSPYIADIVAATPIRSKLRLCLVDALRVVYDGGPIATAGTIADEGILLVSQDPVATDTVGLAILNDIRQRYELTPVARSADDLGYLAAAHRRGLGIAVWHGIELARLKP